MYSLCFLGRTNIRNARLDQLEQYMNLQRGRGVQYTGTVLAAIGHFSADSVGYGVERWECWAAA
jgi:hypothetical protein